VIDLQTLKGIEEGDQVIEFLALWVGLPRQQGAAMVLRQHIA
jgi:hypothetical protein